MEILNLFKVGQPIGAFSWDAEIREYFLGEEDLIAICRSGSNKKIRFLRMRNFEFWQIFTEERKYNH